MSSTQVNNDIIKPNRYAVSYYEIFILSLIIVWLPSKLLAYLTPFICMFWFIIRANSGKSLIRLGCFILVYGILVGAYYLFYHCINEPFILQNAFMSFITYGSFIFFMVLPPNQSVSQINYMKFIKVIEWFIIIQSFLGIFQVLVFVAINGGNFDSSTGDVVQGTLNSLSFMNPSVNFNNQIYTANLLLLLLFYVPFNIAKKRGLLISAIGFIAILMASVLHLFIAFIVAVVLISIYFSSSFIKMNTARLLIAFFLIIAISLTIVLQPKNFALVSYYFNDLSTNRSPKTAATIKAVTKMPSSYPWARVIGLGPGQYSSRAGLIGTGHYFGDFKKPKEIPFIEPNYSYAFKEYVYKDWKDVATNVAKYGNSTMSRPFYSTLSVLTEFGYVIFALILFLLIRFIRKLKKLYIGAQTEKNMMHSFYSIACAAAIVFFIFISFFENYMEVTQAIFPGLLMLYFFNSFLRDQFRTPSSP